MQKAIFLDRDGVINNTKDKYYVYKKDDFYLNKDIFKSLKQYLDNGYLLIVISNQGGISKGIYEKADVENLHLFMLNELKKENIKITEIYYCPHHNKIENCICRKPNSLLIEKAIARFNIDINNSYFIGDSERDILSAQKAGIKGFLIEKNSFLPDLLQLQRL